VTGDAIDGSLLAWEEVASQHAWSALLLGNGLSINVWPRFDYASLFDHARSNGFTDVDRALFDGTRNFEHALSDLTTAMRVNGVLGLDAQPVLDRYQSIQGALGQAIRAVHVSRIPDETLRTIRRELLAYEWIFTTSYDLIVYWAMGCDGWVPFFDAFMHGTRREFDPARAQVRPEQVPVYFLHGALHLVVGGDGTTWKLRRTGLTGLLAQFGQSIDGDPQARPLLVTEGSAREKARSIDGNAYLAHALARLREREQPLVVFGSSLSVQDDHLVEAIREHRERPVAVSMLPGSPGDVVARKAEIIGRLDIETVIFFDARSHPLGASGLRAGEP
jgi:hypothetical protein